MGASRTKLNEGGLLPMTFQGSWRQGSDHVCHQGNVAVNQLEKAKWDQRKILRSYAYILQSRRGLVSTTGWGQWLIIQNRVGLNVVVN